MNLRRLTYYYQMVCEGKRGPITQKDIDTFLDDHIKKGDKSAVKYKKGGNCRVCGKAYIKRSVDNFVGKYSWYLPGCNCEE